MPDTPSLTPSRTEPARYDSWPTSIHLTADPRSTALLELNESLISSRVGRRVSLLRRVPPSPQRIQQNSGTGARNTGRASSCLLDPLAGLSRSRVVVHQSVAAVTWEARGQLASVAAVAHPPVDMPMAQGYPLRCSLLANGALPLDFGESGTVCKERYVRSAICFLYAREEAPMQVLANTDVLLGRTASSLTVDFSAVCSRDIMRLHDVSFL